MNKTIYPPLEDSHFLESFVKKFAFGKVLDIGTGSGIQAVAASQTKGVKSVLGIDINKTAIEHCKKTKKLKKIKFLQSNLFKNVKGKFDTIIFNPPYLPQEHTERDICTEGVRKGYEVVEKFLEQASHYLNKNGIILLLFSSLTNKQKVDEFVRNNLFEAEELGQMKLFFETLYVYKIYKNEVIEALSKKIKSIKYFAKGNRGVVYTGVYKKKRVAIKTELSESEAIYRIQNEAKFLKLLNKKGIGQKLLLAENSFIVSEFISGKPIKEFIESSNKKQIIKVLKEVFHQCLILDNLKINKEEMHLPLKHILIGKTVVMIDFERCHFTEDPKNSRQFLQFLINHLPLFQEKGFKWSREQLIDAAKKQLLQVDEILFC